jgi:hypothetical protein
VVALARPVGVDLLLRGAGLEPHFHRQRGHAFADEAVLVAADEAIALGLRVRPNRDAHLLGDGPDVIAQIGLVETEHHQALHREERQEHVHVDVGDD